VYCITFHANGVVFRVKFSESTETYLKEIYRLSKTDEHVRSIDVASKLNVSKASVNGAVKACKIEHVISQAMVEKMKESYE